MVDRAPIVANSAASLRLEGLRSGPEVDALLAAWARGKVSDETLHVAERRILAGESPDDLLAAATHKSPVRAALTEDPYLGQD